jgi:hypothetical protein
MLEEKITKLREQYSNSRKARKLMSEAVAPDVTLTLTKVNTTIKVDLSVELFDDLHNLLIENERLSVNTATELLFGEPKK